MTRHLLSLIGTTLALWVLVLFPARLLWGDSALWLSGAAMALCLVPTTLSLVWAIWAAKRSPQAQLAVVVGGTGLRMFMVLGGALAIFLLLPGFREPAFWGWVLGFYLFTLALEMALVMLSRRSAANS